MFQFLLHQDFGRTVVVGRWRMQVTFQFLLHQDFGRTQPTHAQRRVGVSVPSSSGLRPDCGFQRGNGMPGFSSFFIRTSAGRETRCESSTFFVSVPSSSGLRPDSLSISIGGGRGFQFLLHQDFGRTRSVPPGDQPTGFSSFFIRTSAGRSLLCLGRRVPRFSSFFIRTSAGQTGEEKWHVRIRFSSFFIRTSAGPKNLSLRYEREGFSSFFIRTSAGRPVFLYREGDVFQFLLHQDFGRTANTLQNNIATGFSSFFIRTSAGPCYKP